MDNFRLPRRNRRYKAHVSLIGTNILHLRNPMTIALWSLAFPGFGHMLLNKALRGVALILWEFYINQKIHLNTAMVLTIEGQFEAAKAALDPELMGLYIPVYLFAFWDSYRSAVDMNKEYLLAERENAPYATFSIGGMEVNYLDKRRPWLAAVWSMGIPSLGQLYLHRIALAGFILVYTIVIVDQSKLILGLHYLILGNIRASSAVLNVQWLLYFPSFYFYTIYDAYVNTVENNKLFDNEMKHYLLSHYQPAGVMIKAGGGTS